MSQTSGFQSGEHDGLQALWEDGDRAFFRLWRSGTDGKGRSVLAVRPVAERPHPTVIDRLTHEYGLRDELDSAWALRPLELVSEGGRSMLVLEDSGGEPLERQLHAPMELGTFLGLAVQITAALGKVHQHGLVHKDIKPHNIIVNCGPETSNSRVSASRRDSRAGASPPNRLKPSPAPSPIWRPSRPDE